MSYPGTGPPVDRDALKGISTQNGKLAQGSQMIVVQNDAKKSGERTGKADKKETKGETSNKEQDDPRKIEQLKSFVPSEKIPADQGVDFPYDI